MPLKRFESLAPALRLYRHRIRTSASNSHSRRLIGSRDRIRLPVAAMGDTEPLKIDMVPLVSGGHLKKPVSLPDSQLSNGIVYTKINKRMSSVQRLLGVPVVQNERPIQKTNVIEKMIELRDAAYRQWKAGGNEPSGARQPLNIDGASPKAKKRKAERPMPIHFRIDMPQYGEDCPGISCRVLATAPNSELWVECTLEVVAFLHKAAHHQIDEGAVDRKHPRGSQNMPVDVPSLGISFSYTRNKFLVQWKDDKGKKHKKHLGDGPESYDDALQWQQDHEGKPTDADDDEAD